MWFLKIIHVKLVCSRIKEKKREKKKIYMHIKRMINRCEQNYTSHPYTHLFNNIGNFDVAVVVLVIVNFFLQNFVLLQWTWLAFKLIWSARNEKKMINREHDSILCHIIMINMTENRFELVHVQYKNRIGVVKGGKKWHNSYFYRNSGVRMHVYHYYNIARFCLIIDFIASVYFIVFTCF